MATNAELQARVDELEAELASGQRGAGAGAGKTKGDYVVLTSALVLRTGPRPNDVRRYMRGQHFEMPGFVADGKVESLVELKAIALDDGKAKQFTSGRVLAQAAGASDDPAASPVLDHLPVEEEDITSADDGNGNGKAKKK